MAIISKILVIKLIILIFYFNNLNAQNIGIEKTELQVSLDSIQITENLFKEIEFLKNQVDELIISKRIYYSELTKKEIKLDYVLIFREVLDNIESNLSLTDENGDILEKFSPIARKRNSNSNTIILKVDTLIDPNGVGHRLFNKDPLLKSLYPKLHWKILLRSVRIETVDPPQVVDPPEVVDQMQILPLKFPSIYLTSNNHRAKQELADRYKEFLLNIIHFYFNKDLIDKYFELEKSQVSDNNIDKIIDLRRKFIIYLKNNYENR